MPELLSTSEQGTHESSRFSDQAAGDQGAPARARLRDGVLTAAVFAVLFAVYWMAPNRYAGDSKYCLATSEALLVSGGLDLSSFGIPAAWRPRGVRQLERRDGKVICAYPVGSALLSLPAVAVSRYLLGLPILDEGGYQAQREIAIGSCVAALFAAGAGAVLFRMARRNLGPGSALGAAFVFGLATSQLSSMSRSLWSQGPLVLLLTLALLERVRWEDGEKQRPVLLALLLGAGFWVRPSAAILALLFAAEIAIHRRSALRRFVVASGASLFAFFAFHQLMTGTPVPTYYRGEFLRNPEPLEAAAGLLVSPSRGLFVFSPVLVMGFLAWVRHEIPEMRRTLAWLCVAAVAGLVTLAALNCAWWGGWSYGPRLLAEAVPFLMALLIWGIAGSPGRSRQARRVPIAATLVLLGWSVYTHVVGAWSPANWNQSPLNVDRYPARLWSWSDPQFFAWSRRPIQPQNLWPPEPLLPCAPARSEVDRRVPAASSSSDEREPRGNESAR